jgi:hypothetical protein
LARRGFLESLLRTLLKASIRQIASSGNRSVSTSSSKRISHSKQSVAKDHYKTRHRVPNQTVQLASRGMHAYPVSGETFYEGNFRILRERFQGREEVFTRAYLIPEPDNPWDKNAVAVVILEYVVGHIPRHTAAHFSQFLAGRAGECGARLYFNPFSDHNSVELDCSFPLRLPETPESSNDLVLGSEKPPVYSMSQVTTRGSELLATMNLGYADSIKLAKDSPHCGIAYLREGFRNSPEIVDAETLRVIGMPYESISYDFNLFARSYGGEVKVRYMLILKDNGRPQLFLDSSALPEFKKKKY